MATYQIDLPDGRSFEIDAPDEASLSLTIKSLMDTPKPRAPRTPSEVVAAIPGNSAPVGSGRQPPGLIDRAIGAAETGMSLVTGIPASLAAMPAGFLGGLAGAIRTGELGTDEGARRVQGVTENAAARFTYAPRTTEGQRQTAAVGDAIAQTVPLAPMAAEIGAIAGNAARARPAVQAAARQRAVATAERVAPRVVDRVRRVQEEAAMEPSPLNPNVRVSAEQAAKERAQKYAADNLGTRLSDLPAAIRQQLETVARDATALEGLDPAAVRRQTNLQSLPVPVPATRGDLTRDLTQITQEQNIVKTEAGLPIRNVRVEQDVALPANIDTLRGRGRVQTREGLGNTVQGALRDKKRAVSAARRDLYQRAEESGATQAPVEVALLDEWLLDPVNRANAGYIAQRLDQFREGPNAGITINRLERIREEANRHRKGPPSTESFYAGDAIGVIDEILDRATEALPEGNAYRAARAAYRAEKAEFDRQARIKALVTEKGMTTDRAVALEDTLDHVMRSSAADIRAIRKSLTSGGTQQTRRNGAQAWRDLRVGVLERLKEAGVGRRDIPGEQGQSQFNSSFLNTYNELRADGKIEALFSPKEVALLDKVAEAVRTTRTTPSGRIAGSDTASNAMAIAERVIRYLPVGGDVARGLISKGLELREAGKQAARVRQSTVSPLAEAAAAPPPKPRSPTLRDYFNASPPP